LLNDLISWIYTVNPGDPIRASQGLRLFVCAMLASAFVSPWAPLGKAADDHQTPVRVAASVVQPTTIQANRTSQRLEQAKRRTHDSFSLPGAADGAGGKPRSSGVVREHFSRPSKLRNNP
jgi:hypothetical protein